VAVGFFDDDDVPDFLVKYQHGPGYPVYDFEQVRRWISYLEPILRLLNLHMYSYSASVVVHRRERFKTKRKKIVFKTIFFLICKKTLVCYNAGVVVVVVNTAIVS
jgi:hypothetical protein